MVLTWEKQVRRKDIFNGKGITRGWMLVFPAGTIPGKALVWFHRSAAWQSGRGEWGRVPKGKTLPAVLFLTPKL